VKQADEIAAELRQIVATTPRAEALRREQAEAMKMMALIGTKLRVCPSSNKSTKDGRRRHATYPRPWEDWGDDHKKPWEDGRDDADAG